MASGYQFVSGSHNRYVDPAADGTRDGTQATNHPSTAAGPWTITQALTAGAGTALDVWVKSGDYTIGATTVTLGGQNTGSLDPVRLLGYQITPGDLLTPCNAANPRILPAAGVTSGNFLTLSGSRNAWANINIDCSGRTVTTLRLNGNNLLCVGCQIRSDDISTSTGSVCFGSDNSAAFDRCQLIGGDVAFNAFQAVFQNGFIIGARIGVGAGMINRSVAMASNGTAVNSFNGSRVLTQVLARSGLGPYNDDGTTNLLDALVVNGGIQGGSTDDAWSIRRLRATSALGAATRPRSILDYTQVANPFDNFTHSATPDLRLNAAGQADLATLRLMYDLRDVPLPAGSQRDSVAQLEAWMGALASAPGFHPLRSKYVHA